MALRTRASTRRGSFNHFSQPAMVQGSIGMGNTISVHAQGVKSVTVWLSRGMVDFDKPVTILLNRGTPDHQSQGDADPRHAAG